jgi:hypothetical protein
VTRTRSSWPTHAEAAWAGSSTAGFVAAARFQSPPELGRGTDPPCSQLGPLFGASRHPLGDGRRGPGTCRSSGPRLGPPTRPEARPHWLPAATTHPRRSAVGCGSGIAGSRHRRRPQRRRNRRSAARDRHPGAGHRHAARGQPGVAMGLLRAVVGFLAGVLASLLWEWWPGQVALTVLATLVIALWLLFVGVSWRALPLLPRLRNCRLAPDVAVQRVREVTGLAEPERPVAASVTRLIGGSATCFSRHPGRSASSTRSFPRPRRPPGRRSLSTSCASRSSGRNWLCAATG